MDHTEHTMSSLHDRDGGADADADADAGQQRQMAQKTQQQTHEQTQQQQQRAQHQMQPGSAGKASAAPSYAAQLHVDCVMTFRGTGQGAGNKDDLRIGVTAKHEASPGACIAADPMSITCNFTVEHGIRPAQCNGEASNADPAPASEPAQPEAQARDDTLAIARARRTAALDAYFGMWKDRVDIPDGLQFQKEMREEWP